MTRQFLYPLTCASALALVVMAPLSAKAQEAETHGDPANSGLPTLSVELNDAASIEGNCRLTFLVENGLGMDLAGLSLETVVMTADGVVDQLTLFEFGELPTGRPRVRQFDLAGLSCEGVGQVLINGVTACEGEGLEPAACASGLALSSRGEIELIG